MGHLVMLMLKYVIKHVIMDMKIILNIVFFYLLILYIINKECSGYCTIGTKVFSEGIIRRCLLKCPTGYYE